MNDKVDNSALAEKVALREAILDQLHTDTPKILDAYGGQGEVWAALAARRPDLTIDRTAIDRRPIPGVIVGDNTKIMGRLNLATFDVIDLDAYGWPAAQLALAAHKAPATPVAVTLCTHRLGQIPHAVLDAVGIPRTWPATARRAFNTTAALSIWRDYCARLGYRQLWLDRSGPARMIRYYMALWAHPTDSTP